MDKIALDRMFASHKVLNLAYHDDSGIGCCALWYAHDPDFNLYFLSSTTTRHGTAIAKSPEVAFTIQRDDQDWQSITGIQGRGRVVVREGHQQDWYIYTEKFPFVLQQFEDLESAMEDTKLWRITPNWLRRIDNRVKFGFKEELSFEGTE